MKSWLSLLAAVVALLVANPGFASVVRASDHSIVKAAAPSHCANMMGDHGAAGGKPASPCDHCLLCGVAFVAPPEAPTAARFVKSRRLEPLAVELAGRPPEQARSHRARASPAAV